MSREKYTVVIKKANQQVFWGPMPKKVLTNISMWVDLRPAIRIYAHEKDFACLQVFSFNLSEEPLSELFRSAVC